MLILTRHVGENIMIGDDIVISVVEVRGEAVRIGIEAPKSLPVHREEVWQELQRANAQAAQSSDTAIGSAVRDLIAETDAPPAPGRQRGRPHSD